MNSDTFELFPDLPPEIRRQIYILATPPRFVHIREWPPPTPEAYRAFREWFAQALPSQLVIHPSLEYFAGFWSRYILGPKDQADFQLQRPRLRQSTLDRYGFTVTASDGEPPSPPPQPWTPSLECPRIDPIWLSESPRFAWHWCRRSSLYSKAPIPPLLHTCREARQFLADYGYTLAFATRTAEPQTWFHFDRDVLCLGGRHVFQFISWDWVGLGDLLDIPYSIAQFRPRDLQRIKQLALPFDFTPSSPSMDQRPLRMLNNWKIPTALRVMPSVEELFCVGCIVDHAAERPWLGVGTNIEAVMKELEDQDDGLIKYWEWIDYNGADDMSDSLRWLRSYSKCGDMGVFSEVEDPVSAQGSEAHLESIVKSIRRLLVTGEDSGSGEEINWELPRPKVRVGYIGSPGLLKQVTLEREEFWEEVEKKGALKRGR
ncbi:hypothetical protein ACJ41O_000761 [Fusarium nematophilum]